MKQLLLSLLFISLLSCQNEEPCKTFELEKPVEIAFQETLTHCTESISVSFLDIIHDSRCPEDVVCIWQGFVEVKVTFSVKGLEKTAYLSSSPSATDSPSEISVNGYTLKMMDVTPYPNTSAKFREEDYRLLYQVEKTTD